MSEYTPPPPPPPPPAMQAPDIIHPTAPPKDPGLAVILNVFAAVIGLAGAGYFYLGQWQKGIVGIFAGWMLLTVTVLGLTFCIGIFFVPVYLGYVVFTAIDIHKQATFLRDGVAIGQWTFLAGHR